MSHANDIGQQVPKLAESLLQQALSQQTSAEQAEAAKLGRLMNDPAGKAFTFAMVDEVFRSHDAATSARRWRGLMRVFGIPKFPPLLDRMLMGLGAFGSLILPKVVMKAVAAG
jgi:RHH-type proline utilization regulon transcriptional repressor/proline dehydrogenase/delta 1-pyrroline-5-carboxylate dehydrogenase